MAKVYIGYQGYLPVRVETSRDAVEKDIFLKCDRIEEYEGSVELINGKVLFESDLLLEKRKLLGEKCSAFIKNILDKKAQELSYDNIDSVCAYENCGVTKFHDEAVSYKKWRAAVWNTGIKLIADAQEGIRVIDTEEEMACLLPALELVYTDATYTPVTGE